MRTLQKNAKTNIPPSRKEKKRIGNHLLIQQFAGKVNIKRPLRSWWDVSVVLYQKQNGVVRVTAYASRALLAVEKSYHLYAGKKRDFSIACPARVAYQAKRK